MTLRLIEHRARLLWEVAGDRWRKHKRLLYRRAQIR
jgi:hypothetical protein